MRRGGLRAPSLRHVLVAALTAALFAVFWFSRLDWAPEMRLWRATGDVALILLFATLVLGPAAKFSVRAGMALPWRRELGIWAGLIAVLHSVLVIDGWAQWSVRRFLGYEFIPQLGREVRLESGFGLANLMGLVAVIWMVVLMATSSDRAMRYLGPASWKWLHNSAYVVFYLSVLHTVYFLFIHYTLSFHRAPPPPNWFRLPLLVLGATVLILQGAAFVRTVRRRGSRSPVGARG